MCWGRYQSLAELVRDDPSCSSMHDRGVVRGPASSTAGGPQFEDAPTFNRVHIDFLQKA